MVGPQATAAAQADQAGRRDGAGEHCASTPASRRRTRRWAPSWRNSATPTSTTPSAPATARTHRCWRVPAAMKGKPPAFRRAAGGQGAATSGSSAEQSAAAAAWHPRRRQGVGQNPLHQSPPVARGSRADRRGDDVHVPQGAGQERRRLRGWRRTSSTWPASCWSWARARSCRRPIT